MAGERGFTLLELMAVMLLVSLLLFLTVPHFTGFLDDYRLRSEASNLAQYLRYVRSQAVMDGYAGDVLFFADGRRYFIKTDNRLVTVSDGICLYNNFGSIGGTPTCRFLPSGAPSRGGHVLLLNRQGHKKYVIVGVATGRIRVSDQPPTADDY